jgi:hypothetical protein
MSSFYLSHANNQGKVRIHYARGPSFGDILLNTNMPISYSEVILHITNAGDTEHLDLTWITCAKLHIIGIPNSNLISLSVCPNCTISAVLSISGNSILQNRILSTYPCDLSIITLIEGIKPEDVELQLGKSARL